MSETEELSGYLDSLGIPKAATLLDRVRDFYHACTDKLRTYQEKCAELPAVFPEDKDKDWLVRRVKYLEDHPQQSTFVEGWKRCLVFVVRGAAGVPADERGLHAAIDEHKRWLADLEERRRP